MKTRTLVVILCVALLPTVSQSAPPEIPEAVSYQGVLLDSGGLPRTGTVDLVLRIYDAATSGTLVYKQEFASVGLNAGVFSIELGPTGSSTDVPTDPLATDLATALGADAGVTAPQRFLEVTVGLEGALARTQVLTVPYALRASRADNADSADVALSVTTFGGLPPEVLSELYEHTNLDGVGESNAGPTEGFGDTDGDGIANFVDADNDNDGRDDTFELNAGTDPNLVTPRIDTLAPLQTFSDEPDTFQVTGANFDGSMTTTLGAEVLAISNLTSTSFDATTVGQAPGTVPFRVELVNLESDQQDVTLIIRQPIIDMLVPNTSSVGFPVTVTVSGQNFVPGLTVLFEAQTPVPQNLTDTSFEVDLVSEPLGVYPLIVTLPNGESTSADYTFSLELGPHGLSVNPQTQLSVAAGATDYIIGAEDEYGVNLGPPVAFPGEGAIAVALDSSEALAGLRCRDTAAGECTVELTIDTDADFELSDETPTTIEV
ncbi:MAG: IPT/TIG domain-containing protein, partial [Myxococcota bacterium]